MLFDVLEITLKHVHICIVLIKTTTKNKFFFVRLYNTYNLIRLKRLSIVAVLVALSLIGFFETSAQDVLGWEKVYGAINGPDEAKAIVEMQDHGLVMVGYSNSFGNANQIYTIRTDVDGTELWSNIEGTAGQEMGLDVTVAHDQDGVVIVGNGNDLVNGGKDVILFKLDDSGVKQWTKFFSTTGDNDDEALSIAPTNDGGYIITGYTEDVATGNKDVFLWKVDGNGDEEFRKFYGNPLDDIGTAVIQKPNGNFVVTGRTEETSQSFDIIYLEVNSTGDIVIDFTGYGVTDFDSGEDLVLAPNGNIFITGQSGGQSDVALLEINSNAGFENLSVFGENGVFEIGHEIVVTQDGNLMIVGYHEVTALNINYFLIKINTLTGNEIFRKSIGQDDFLEFGEGITETYDGGFAIAGSRSNSFGLGFDVYLVKTDENGETLTNQITGKAFRDANNDCTFQNDETSLRNWIVEAKGVDRTFYGSVDANGDFSVRTDSGSYELNIIIPNVYWNSNTCQTPDFQVDVNDFDIVNLDYPIQTEIVCPVMEVDVATSRIIPCEDNVYRVDFCNQGTELAVGVQVDLIFEKNLTVLNSTIPSIFVDDSLHVFTVGNIDIGACGFFEVTVNADCNTTLADETHCVEARITPDATCLADNPNWDGSSISVNSYCDGDSIVFEIVNIGNNPMTQGSDYIVTEDVVMLQQPAPSDLLAPGEKQTIKIAANGKHYRLIANQSPNHPGRNYFATSSVEACDPNNTGSSLGFVTQLEEADRDPYQSKDCIENQLSFDAIDFKGYPKGYKDTCSTNTDLITSQTDLKYHIRFQNVGMDTSGRVVIRDTIPSNLDITSIRPGASSHPYIFEAYGNGFIKFTFENLDQPNSTTNELLSHGFVKYRISQKPNNPVGTIIENGAIVYQDYDAPNITEYSRHQVGGEQLTDFVCFLTSIENPELPHVSIEVYPNPFTDFAKIKVEGEQFKNMDFHVFDTAGKKVRTEKFESNTLEFYRNQLPQGLYVFTIEVKGLVVQSGKLIIQ